MAGSPAAGDARDVTAKRQVVILEVKIMQQASIIRGKVDFTEKERKSLGAEMIAKGETEIPIMRVVIREGIGTMFKQNGQGVALHDKRVSET